jgi:uroporphyrinogen decarboxylase
MKNTDSLFLQALSGKVTTQVPLWLMRQAGRYLPEYRALRAEAGSFLNLCFNPEFATEVTLQPLRRFDFDAAILFSDILVVPYALGQDLNFVEGEGPKLGALDHIGFDEEIFHAKLSPVYDTVSKLRATLPRDKALIGFAGAPWTVASYMVQGHGNGVFEKLQNLAASNPVALDHLIETVTHATTEYLLRQIEAGADVVQIFDSWAGLAKDDHFDRYVIAPTKKIVSALHQKHPGFPVIGFPRQAGGKVARYAKETGVQGLGLGQEFSLSDRPKGICIQGNLDPEVLLKGGTHMREETLRILTEMKDDPFIFNLGHGVIKETPPEHVAEVVSIVKGFQRS